MTQTLATYDNSSMEDEAMPVGQGCEVLVARRPPANLTTQLEMTPLGIEYWLSTNKLDSMSTNMVSRPHRLAWRVDVGAKGNDSN